MNDHAPPLPRYFLAVSVGSAAWLAPLLWLHATSSRLLVSWHGLLHSAIALRFPSDTLIPENPFFAGEPLPYYWFYHWVGRGLGSLLGIYPLVAFRLLALASLIVLVAAAAWIGRQRFRSLPAGLLIGYLAIAGLNPFGPAVAAARFLLQDRALTSSFGEVRTLETVFVDNQTADDYMTHPLLGAMHIGGDWQFGQNLAWFVDITGRTPALALVMVLAMLLVRRRAGAGTYAALIASTAGITALDPLMGLAVVGFSGATCAAAALWNLARADAVEVRRWLTTGASCGLGAVSALPTYYQILLLSENTGSISTAPYVLLGSAFMTANFVALLPLALLGLAGRPIGSDQGLWVLTISGAGLTVVVPFIHLKTGVEHDLSNAGQVLLAVAAVQGVWWLADRLRARRRTLELATFLLFLPVTLCTLYSYSGRPPVPLSFVGGEIHRVPDDHPLERFYGWAREHTPREAVFIYDVRRCVKMANNVAELPAFTGRTLFVDQPSYLIDSYADLERRSRISTTLAEGGLPPEEDLDYLRALARPMYLVSYEADREPRLAALTARHGPPLFMAGFVAVFPLAP